MGGRRGEGGGIDKEGGEEGGAVKGVGRGERGGDSERVEKHFSVAAVLFPTYQI